MRKKYFGWSLVMGVPLLRYREADTRLAKWICVLYLWKIKPKCIPCSYCLELAPNRIYRSMVSRSESALQQVLCCCQGNISWIFKTMKSYGTFSIIGSWTTIYTSFTKKAIRPRMNELIMEFYDVDHTKISVCRNNRSYRNMSYFCRDFKSRWHQAALKIDLARFHQNLTVWKIITWAANYVFVWHCLI
jgi:hypothetical protein